MAIRLTSQMEPLWFHVVESGMAKLPCIVHMAELSLVNINVCVGYICSGDMFNL